MVTVHKRAGSPFYQARINVAGSPRRVSTGKRGQGEALAEGQRLEAEQNRALRQDGDLTLLQGAERFFQEKRHLRPQSIRQYKHNLTNVYEILGDFTLRSLTVADVGHYVNTRKMRRMGSPQLNQDLKWLSSLLSSAWYWNCGVTDNVVKRYPKRGIPLAKERDRFCTTAEAERLLAACRTDRQRMFVILALFTGMRHRELLGLRWEEVDMKERIITLPAGRTKSKKARLIPIVDTPFDTLSTVPPGARSGYVLRGQSDLHPARDFGEAWRAIRARAKLTDVRIHDLRHTFASWWLQNGGSEMVLQGAMGHASLKQTQKYAHQNLASIRNASSVLNRVTLHGTNGDN